jgi:hypothetical protein
MLNVAFYLLLCWISLCWMLLGWMSWCRLERFSSDKHSSLLQTFVIYGRKKLWNVGQNFCHKNEKRRVQYFLSSVQTRGWKNEETFKKLCNKLERLTPENIFVFVYLAYGFENAYYRTLHFGRLSKIHLDCKFFTRVKHSSLFSSALYAIKTKVLTYGVNYLN